MHFQATHRHLHPFPVPVAPPYRSDTRDDKELKRNAACMPYMSSDIHLQCKLYGWMCRPWRKCDTEMGGYIKSGFEGKEKNENEKFTKWKYIAEL